ncbi:A disintegrin and metalloproteinase with thrombospondin motifs 18 [Plakobranchus ocellatus]|uniref:A disintegrin and metalloproteinase with thrombospondin motifs 18 n=1 Tax=Plakobranchus ocellatus TaxID=259542 RepID=A0AAV4BBW3_9GAST|nr:A disintegrin and metalloproteinase with thrombospondin motifs 18 [Plakobranchus ocellatus]
MAGFPSLTPRGNYSPRKMPSLTTCACLGLSVYLSLLCGSLAQEYALEVLVVLDGPSQLRWSAKAQAAGNTVQEEAPSVMFEVNKLFRRMANQGADISVRLVDNAIFYTREHILSGKDLHKKDGETYVDPKKAQEVFKDWVKGKTFDIAIFIPGYAFLNDNLPGSATLDTVCEKGVSVINPTYDTAMLSSIAHELGHSLGLRNDGDGNNCKSNDGYIMASKQIPSHENYMTWSKCSVDLLKKKLPTKKCLAPADNTEEITAARFGHIVNVDEICMRAGSKYISRFAYKNGDYSNLCRVIACETSLKIETERKKFLIIPYGKNTKFEATYTNIRPLPGMHCGWGKTCNKGLCVKDDTVKQTWNAQCPFGDSPYLEGDIKTCREVKDKDKCKEDDYRSICCQSCA